MKIILSIAIALLAATPMFGVSQPRSKSNQYVQGTVVAVQKHEVYSSDTTMGGSNPSDAPLTSQYYTYEVSVRVDCMTYVGRYETPFNYLPSVFTPDQSIHLRLTKHAMYFDLPYNPDVRMGIIHRSSQCGQNR